MFYSCKSQFREKNSVSPIEKFLFLALARNIMLQHLIYFSLHYLSSGHLQEIKDKDKFQTYNSQSGRSRLWEVVAYKRFHI